MREVKVHAANAEEARSDGAAALGVPPRYAQVEILAEDEDGVTALVTVPVEPDAAPLPAEPAPADTADVPDDDLDDDLDAIDPNRRQPGDVDDDDEDEDEDDEEEDEEEEADPDSVAAVSGRANRTLRHLLRLMGVDARCEVVSATEDEILLNIIGEELGIVIGAGGQTLNALQFLLNLMVNRGGRRRRLTVDAEGYRERRRQRLEEVAGEHARRAKAERRPVILEGLRAAERRIIHTALQNDPDIVTYSEGEEPHRRLIITPRA